MNQFIVDAIQNRQILQLRYDDELRIVEPHCYGVDSSGVEKLRCYQPGPDGAIYDSEDWKIFNVAQIEDLTATGGYFSGSRLEYKREDSQMSRFYARLEANPAPSGR